MNVKEFKQKIEIFPKHSSDLNVIFAVTYAEYKIEVKTMETLLYLNEILKSGISAGLQAINDTTYNFIIGTLDTLNKTLISVLPEPLKNGMRIDVQVGVVGDLLSVACTDYFGSLPESLYNKFQDIKNMLNKKLDFPMGKALMNSLVSELLSLKDQILLATLGPLFGIILAPIIAYESFLKENGILKILKRMEAIEKCLTKKGVGNRPVADFMHPDSKKLYSQHFRNQLLLDSRGNFSIKYLDVDTKTKSRFNNIMKSMISFRLSVK